MDKDLIVFYVDKEILMYSYIVLGEKVYLGTGTDKKNNNLATGIN